MTDTPELEAKWGRVRERLRSQLGDDLFNSWFARLEIESFDGWIITLSVPTLFLRSWINSHYGDKLNEIWLAEEPRVKRIELRVRSHGDAARNKNDLRPGMARPTPPGTNAATGAVPDARAAHSNGAASPLDARYTFETFVVGRSNALAHAAARQIASTAPGAPIEYNPLFIHGSVGLGKTHLLNAIAWEVKRQFPARRVMLLSAVRFMSSFIEAIKNRDTITFKKIFTAIDLLLVDDMQFLQGKSVQQEFCHLFNALENSKCQVVIAGDQIPARMEALDERIRSRLSGGLVLQINAPDTEMRQKVLTTRARQFSKTGEHSEISSEILSFLAHRVQGSGRDLEGALNRVIAVQKLRRRPATIEEAGEAVRDLVTESQPRHVMIEDVLRAIAGHFNVTRADLLSARRHKTVVYPRQIGMYLAKTLTTRSLPEIGRKFGGRDHTTVLHAVRKIERLLGEDPTTRYAVETLQDHLRD